MNAICSHRILVIDDTPTIHDDVRKILTPASGSAAQIETLAAAIFGQTSAAVPSVRFAVDCAAQGQTGLALVQDALTESRPYAVAFVDMRMPPGWDGLETIRRLWAADPHLQVVICTAYSDYMWSAITERLGESDNLLILKKPFDNIELLQITHALSRKWKLAREREAQIGSLEYQLRVRTAELRSAEECFTAAFDATPVAQAIVSLESPAIIAVNPAFEKAMGLTKAQALGLTPESFGRRFDPDGCNGLLAHLGSGAAVDNHECVFHPAPGTSRDLLWSARPLTIKGRQCSLWVLRDVTDQFDAGTVRSERN